MGTDITAFVEVLTPGGWEPIVKPIFPNDGFRKRQEKPFGPTPNIGRHYPLFSVLADVRNNTGRGSTSWVEGKDQHGNVVRDENGKPYLFEYNTDDGGHAPLNYIAEPRGIPEDAFEPWRLFVEHHPGTHDATWLTCAELEAADWDQPLFERIQMVEEDYRKYLEDGTLPKIKPSGIGGPGMRVVTETEYDAGIRGEQTSVTVALPPRPLREALPGSWWALLAVLNLLAPEGDLEKVRLLVVFDS